VELAKVALIVILAKYFSQAVYAVRQLRYLIVSALLTLGMLVFSVITISTFIMEIPTGIFSDMIGRRKTTILGTIVAFAEMVGQLGCKGGFTRPL